MAENWIVSQPVDHTKIGDIPTEIRNVKKLAVNGMARLFFQSSAPTTRYESTAFSSDDNGSIWIDSDDNKVYILTDYSGPTWTSIESVTIATFLASAREIAFADATLTLKNTDAEDSDGGRQSKLIVKGVQSGDEETTLGYIEVSHEGSSDDEKGQLVVKLNDGDDGDSPSKQPIGFQSTGKIDVASSLSVLDQDDMSDDDAECVPTQQSVKAYVQVKQVVNTMVAAVSNNSTAFPVDDTIPQKTEGGELMTLAITPKSATSKLKIEVVVNCAGAGTDKLGIGLFQDSTAGALAAVMSHEDASGRPRTITFTHYMTSGTTSSTTFKIRGGNHGGGVFTFNGISTARIFGGVIASSITITEIGQ